MTLLLAYVLLALGVSFACSVMEAVLLSVTPSYVALLERDGEALGRRLRYLKENIDRPLSGILTLNTIAHTAGAAGAGAQAALVFGDAYVGVFSAVLTLLILLLSEIVPKTLGAVYWRRLTPAVVWMVGATVFCLYPLVWALEVLTKLLSRGKREERLSREEMGAMVDLAAEHGAIKEGESKIFRNLFRLSSLTAQDIMTPRTVLLTLNVEDTIADVIASHDSLQFSRVPVHTGSLDDVTGYVLKDRLLLQAAKGHDGTKVGRLKREILVVPYVAPLPRILDTMLDQREHIALVVDEYGGTAGVVTMEDIVETLLGMEIVDEADSVSDMQALARRHWRHRARKLGLLTEEEDGWEESPKPPSSDTSPSAPSNPSKR